MRILIGGASGLVGTALVRHLTQADHQVAALVRSTPVPGAQSVPWQPDAGILDGASLEGFDAVAHLGGETIQALRWTAAKKRGIYDSRVKSTRLLAERLAALAVPPAVFLCASAVGYYGHRGDEELSETAAPGSGFMSETCQAWEAAVQPARDAGIRVINLRIGLALSRDGGVLPILRRVFRAGLGGPIGGGGMYVSWIDLSDLVAAAVFCLEQPEIEGPVNAVSPHPVTNAELTRLLSSTLHRPAFFPVPRFAVKMALGEMGEELLLASMRVRPRVLVDHGFSFAYPELGEALRHQFS